MAVYTALFGNYDNIVEPKESFPGCNFILFTDQNNLKSKIWQTKLVNEKNEHPAIANRKYKFFPHYFLPDYEISLYVDANIFIRKNPIDLAVKYLKDYSIAIPKHFSRNCLYDEAIEIIKTSKGNISDITSQINFYKSKDLKSSFGLTENNIIYRKHNDSKIIELMNQWWAELHKWPCKRDQLSFMYLVYKNDIDIKIMDETARGGNYFKMMLHKKDLDNGSISNLVNPYNCYLLNHPNLIGKKKDVYIKKFLKTFNRLLF